MNNKKKSAFLLLECLLANLLFIVFTTTFIGSCGYLLKAHYTAIASLRALEELVIAAEEEDCTSSLVMSASVIVTMQLENPIVEPTSLQSLATYYVHNQQQNLGILRYAGSL